ncbi:MAG: CCA tRNA nucleotidyltransferase, partial [Mesorhizobium sp.]
WKLDAERRDFTINALYAEADGNVVDLVGGIADIAARRLRFIGDAEARIREDYLRILRFFRFFAWYGDGRPDAEG